MGWAHCGTDSDGREIGYSIQATCDHRWGAQKCRRKIDRGLAYACGGMHGEDEVSCEGYFCARHLYYAPGIRPRVCRRCLALAVRTASRAGEARVSA
jgi:hypothetical protein